MTLGFLVIRLRGEVVVEIGMGRGRSKISERDLLTYHVIVLDALYSESCPYI